MIESLIKFLNLEGTGHAMLDACLLLQSSALRNTNSKFNDFFSLRGYTESQRLSSFLRFNIVACDGSGGNGYTEDVD